MNGASNLELCSLVRVPAITNMFASILYFDVICNVVKKDAENTSDTNLGSKDITLSKYLILNAGNT